ncbi:MAG TPA: lysylphosphatidylglycerol synthase domain-containing protein [Candidatus Binataceae bacterium]|nr:lysylphosphatidylglycerol synthase domain-containing protein [Candidatus Binataceae bacterium]
MNALVGSEFRARLRRPLKRALQSTVPYLLGLAIVLYLVRGTSLATIERALSGANTTLFILASVGSVVIWYVGETFLFARLYSYFNARISFHEMLAPNAAQYFLQIVNMALAGSALVFFMYKRKAVPFLSGGCTLIFQTLIDLELMAVLWLAGAVLEPHGAAAAYAGYAAAALLLGLTVSFFWLRGRPRSEAARWIYDRPALHCFREARLSHYARLTAIRGPIFLGQGIMLYFQLEAFNIHLPFAAVFGLLAPVLLLDGVPVTPVGIGPLQAVLVSGFSAYGSQADLLAMGLGISAVNIALRIPLGLGAAGTFAREVLAAD